MPAHEGALVRASCNHCHSTCPCNCLAAVGAILIARHHGGSGHVTRQPHAHAGAPARHMGACQVRVCSRVPGLSSPDGGSAGRTGTVITTRATAGRAACQDQLTRGATRVSRFAWAVLMKEHNFNAVCAQGALSLRQLVACRHCTTPFETGACPAVQADQTRTLLPYS